MNPSIRTALITGASRGIGEAILSQFKLDGFKIIAPSRDELDLLSDNSISEYLNELKEPIDVLVNNAGINILGECDQFKEDDLLSIFQINLIAPIKLTKGLIPLMKSRHFGRIINLSSIWSIVSRNKRLLYTISKSGMNGFTRALALELAPYNILVNAVAPGYVKTELTLQNNTPEEIERINQQIPLGRMAEPEEIAAFVSFLGSEKNTYITGQTLLIDGGYTCQ